jgi:hypothetical protein
MKSKKFLEQKLSVLSNFKISWKKDHRLSSKLTTGQH